MVKPDVTPDAPVEEQPAIGLIGMGAMGTMYAKQLAAAGWKRYDSHRPFYSGFIDWSS